VPVAEVPSEWLAAMTPRPRLRVVAGGKGEPFPEGERNNSLYRRACSMRSAGFDRDAILAAIMAENETRCVPPLDPAEVKGIADSAARHPEGLSPEYQAARVAARKPATVAEPTDGGAAGDWVAALYTSKGGAVKNTFANLCAILRNDAAYVSLRHNAMTLAPEIGGEAVTDARMGLIREEIEHRYGISPSGDSVAQALVAVASERAYHPVQEYLGGLTWDGVERLTGAAADSARGSSRPSREPSRPAARSTRCSCWWGRRGTTSLLSSTRLRGPGGLPTRTLTCRIRMSICNSRARGWWSGARSSASRGAAVPTKSRAFSRRAPTPSALRTVAL